MTEEIDKTVFDKIELSDQANHSSVTEIDLHIWGDYLQMAISSDPDSPKSDLGVVIEDAGDRGDMKAHKVHGGAGEGKLWWAKLDGADRLRVEWTNPRNGWRFGFTLREMKDIVAAAIEQADIIKTLAHENDGKDMPISQIPTKVRCPACMKWMTECRQEGQCSRWQ